jgi:hypothetical protein
MLGRSHAKMSRAWEPAAKCEVIFARALSTAFHKYGNLSSIPAISKPHSVKVKPDLSPLRDSRCIRSRQFGASASPGGMPGSRSGRVREPGVSRSEKQAPGGRQRIRGRIHETVDSAQVSDFFEENFHQPPCLDCARIGAGLRRRSADRRNLPRSHGYDFDQSDDSHGRKVRCLHVIIQVSIFG